jgi:hypothetical protein
MLKMMKKKLLFLINKKSVDHFEEFDPNNEFKRIEHSALDQENEEEKQYISIEGNIFTNFIL